MPKVQVLPDTLASQVAAGEVVERPGSVVKELVENSLDAGAKRVEVEIKKGGVALIKVEDDGCGMSKEDALLSLERHATSKLREAKDLAAILTLGFRGEALPSIASVSRFQLTTREADAVEGTEINVEGGSLREVKESGCPVGTTISVADLFYNIPARRKFLKAEGTESAHVDFQTRLHALSHPEVRFVFRKDGKVAWDAAGVSGEKGRRVRIGQLHGSQTAADLVEIPSTTSRGVTVEGYVLPAAMARKGRRQQYLFLNGRPVEDSVLVKGVREGFRGELAEGFHPVVWLWMEMDPILVDVNVHPAKREVRFRKASDVHLAIAEAVSEGLRSERRRLRELEQSRIDEAREFVPEAPVSEPILGSLGGDTKKVGMTKSLMPRPVLSRERQEELAVATEPDEQDAPVKAEAHPFSLLASLKDQYVVLESEDGIVFLDPKAALERIHYEKLISAMKAGEIETQNLLVPIVLELEARDADFVLRNAENFRDGGISVEAFGGNSLQVDSLPAFLGDCDARQLLESLIDDMLEAENTSSGKAIVFESFAKHLATATARGEKAKISAADQLLQQLFVCDLPYCAPDGRATLVQIAMSELDKKFGK